MLQKVYVRNPITNKLYQGYYSANTPYNTPFFTKSIMKKIIEEINETNQAFKCDVIYVYDKNSDKVICKDNEFRVGAVNSYNSHMLYTNFGLMKLYCFGDEIDWEITSKL